jgi:hypothetical protein
MEHYETYETQARSAPDIAVFQSWADVPNRFFPASANDTLAGLISSYLRWRQSH